MRRRLPHIAIIVLMACLWLVQAVHCHAGSISGMEFPGSNASASAEDEAHACCGGTCKAIEARQSKAVEKKRHAAPHAESLAWLTKALSALLLSEPDTGSRISRSDVPPELPKCWHFLSRTALPVRAPSFAS